MRRVREPDRCRQRSRDGNAGCARCSRGRRARVRACATLRWHTPSSSDEIGRQAATPDRSNIGRAARQARRHRLPSCRRSLAPGADPAQRGREILQQRRIRAIDRRRPPDQHEIMSRRGVFRQHGTRGRTQPPACAIAHHRAAHLATHRQSVTHRQSLILCTPRCGLENESRGRPLARRFSKTKKIGPLLQAVQGWVPRHADRRLRPLERRLASTRRPPTLAIRVRKP